MPKSAYNSAHAVECFFRYHDPEDDGIYYDPMLVEQYDVALFEDYSGGERKIVTVNSNIDNDGVEIKTYPAIGRLEEPVTMDMRIRPDDLPEPVRVTEIDNEDELEIDLKSPDGMTHTLVVRHVPATEITETLLIPESLMSPN